MPKADRDARRADLYTDSVDRDVMDSSQLPIQEWEFDNPNDTDPKMRPLSRKLESDYFYFSEVPGEKEFRFRVASDILYIEKWDSGGSTWDAYLTIDADGNVALIKDLLISGTTQSTSKDTGALVVKGGLGVEKDSYFGGTMNALIGITVPVLHVQDQKASGTAGGTFTSGAWRTRVLNTILTNTVIGASLATNQITLPAGTYKINTSSPAFGVNQHAVRFYNITDVAEEITGTSNYSAGTFHAGNTVFITGIFTIIGTKVFEIQHRCGLTKATDGFGVTAGAIFTVSHEVYTDVFIEKIA